MAVAAPHDIHIVYLVPDEQVAVLDRTMSPLATYCGEWSLLRTAILRDAPPNTSFLRISSDRNVTILKRDEV
jgi:hypothetical protein